MPRGTSSGVVQADIDASVDTHAAAADPHAVYALLAGRAGGQTLIGGTAASEQLVLRSTSHSTKGSVWADTDHLGCGPAKAVFFGSPTNADDGGMQLVHPSAALDRVVDVQTKIGGLGSGQTLSRFANSGHVLGDGVVSNTIRGTLVIESATGVVAGTTQTQAGATGLGKSRNFIGTCANSGDGVALPAAASGLQVWIYNGGAQPARIWPASGDDLGAGVDAADTTLLAAGKSREYVALDGTTWVSSVSLA